MHDEAETTETRKTQKNPEREPTTAMGLRGRNVVVTGGTGGLGPAVVQAFVTAGATVHVPCHEEALADDRQLAGVHYTLGVDLRDEVVVQAYYRSLPGLWASIQIAGGFKWTPLADATLAHLEGQLAINAKTCFLCCREAIARLRDGGRGGRLVNVTSQAVRRPSQGLSVYTMSKAAVTALTEALAVELGDEGIWINAIAPSVIDTPANRQAMPDANTAGWTAPSEIAPTIVYLASPANVSVTGAIIPV